MLKIFSELFGLYPFINEKYGNAEFGWKGGGGMEHQTVSSMSDFSEIVIAHELIHQWFGDKITCENWHHIWLNEGFAKYGEALYLEALNGKDAYADFIQFEISKAKNAVGSIYVQDISSPSEIFDGARSYSKGAIVLHMLRGITGDSVFFKIIKSYANDPQISYGTAVTEDFQRVAESVSDLDLDYFFSEWIYGENYPKYIIDWETALVKKNEYEITVNLSQKVNSNPHFFTMPVQIKISTLAGDTLFSFFNDQQNQQIKFTVNGKPISLTIDPGNWILKDAITKNDKKPSPSEFKLEQNYPNPVSPFNPSTIIKYQVPNIGTSKGVAVQLKVYDVLGELIEILVDEKKSPGEYSVIFDTENLSFRRKLASGVYFYSLIIGNSAVITKKMILIK